MGVVKILERKDVIRFFGLALFLSPLFNNITSLLLLPESPNKWSLAFFWKVMTNGGFSDHALALFGIIIGVVMLQGSAATWKFTLALLGCHIFKQLINFGENLRVSWAYGAFFICNVVVFLFIADQLVWKQKTAASTEPGLPKLEIPVPSLSARAQKKIKLQFEGLEPWAQLVNVSSKGILVHALAQPPAELESRDVWIRLQNGLSLRLRLVRINQQDYFFEYLNLTSQEIRLLNQWIQRQAA